MSESSRRSSGPVSAALLTLYAERALQLFACMPVACTLLGPGRFSRGCSHVHFSWPRGSDTLTPSHSAAQLAFSPLRPSRVAFRPSPASAHTAFFPFALSAPPLSDL